MRLIDADALKYHKIYSNERHEKVVPVANIDWMPTIDAVPVAHGRWEFGETLGSSWMKCSQCCKSQSGQTLTFTYCPNCGAKMDDHQD